MNKEDEFTDRLAEKIGPLLTPCLVERKKSLLYDLSFDARGVVTLAIDPDTGEPSRIGNLQIALCRSVTLP